MVCWLTQKRRGACATGATAFAHAEKPHATEPRSVAAWTLVDAHQACAAVQRGQLGTGALAVLGTLIGQALFFGLRLGLGVLLGTGTALLQFGVDRGTGGQGPGRGRCRRHNNC